MFVSVLLWQQVSLYILQRNRRGRLGFSQSVSVTHLFVPFTITTQELVPSPNRDSIVISIPATALMMTDCHLQAGPIFVFPRIHPLTLDAAMSQSKVFSRHEPPSLSSSASRVVKYCLLATVFVIPTFEHKMTWKICDFLLVILQQVSLHIVTGPR